MKHASIKVIQLLLDKGASGVGMALQAAVNHADIEIIRLLTTDKEADDNIQGSFYGTALQLYKPQCLMAKLKSLSCY